ncbi:MAG: sigma-54 dependent transcriptional regulator [Chitinispirillaceae bacterium]|nr:sigma-54 dependent transcriptional regulator [Chitinispirillaceae bacterium]
MARTSSYPVLLVDDEVRFLQSAAITLRLAGFDVTTCSDSRTVPAMLDEKQYGAVMLDILMPELPGTALLPEIVRRSPATQVIMLTAVNDVESAVTCMREGAFDYLVKPVEKERLVTTIRRALDLVELRSENSRLKERLLRNQLECPEAFEEIVTRDPAMIAIFQYIEAIAQTQLPVLVQGETGTGKELVAGAVHRVSGRKGRFVSVNIAGLNDALFGDALFGHERGAFTGAEGKREGLVAAARGGTLFLDEIGDLSMESQVKLLRLIEERTYYPAGSDTLRTTDARFVVATNRDLALLRKEGRFRSDLYYRLEAHEIDLPPLRLRAKDIALLAETFIEEAAAQLNKPQPALSDRLLSSLETYSFPGNIRELRNMMFDAVSISKNSTLDTAAVAGRLDKRRTAETVASLTGTLTIETLSRWEQLPSLREAEQMLVEEALRRAGGNQTIAAQLLGMTRSALNKRLTRAKDSEVPADPDLL